MYENKKEEFNLIYEDNGDYTNIVLPLPIDEFQYGAVEKEEPINIDDMSSSFEYEATTTYKMRGGEKEYGSKEIYENEYLFYIEEGENGTAYIRPVDNAYLFQMRLKSNFEEQEEKKKTEEDDSVDERSGDEQIVKKRKNLTGADIEKVIKKNKVTIKDLLILLKKDFLIDDRAKKVVQVFLKKKCGFTDGKFLVLK